MFTYPYVEGDTVARPYIPFDVMVKAAKEFGKTRGAVGNHGGWISEPGRSLHPVAQGWFNYGSLHLSFIRDYYTARLTAFNSFADLVATDERYCPTILPRTWRERFLADAFDRAMYDRKSPRRAWRGSERKAS